MATTYTFTLRSGVVLSDAAVFIGGTRFDVDEELADGDGSIVTTDEQLAAALTGLRASDGPVFDVNGVPGGADPEEVIKAPIFVTKPGGQIVDADGNLVSSGSGSSSGGPGAGPVGLLDAPSPLQVVGTGFFPGLRPPEYGPDVLAAARFTNPSEAVEQGFLLNGLPGSYFTNPRAPLTAGPIMAAAVGPAAGSGDYLLAPVDPLPSGGWAIPFNVVVGQDVNTISSRLLEGVGDLAGLQVDLLHADTEGDGSQRGYLSFQWVRGDDAIVGQNFTSGAHNGWAAADVPAGSTIAVWLTYEGDNKLRLFGRGPDGIEYHSTLAQNFSPSWTQPPDLSGALRLGKTGQVKISDFQILRHPRTFGEPLTYQGPTVTVDLATNAASQTKAGHLAGLVGQNHGDFGTTEATATRRRALGIAKGTSLVRVADPWEYVTVTDNGVGVVPRFTYDHSKLDPVLADILAAGAKASLTLCYTPPYLQVGGNNQAPPSDLALFAQNCSDLVGHIKTTFPGVLELVNLWNEPQGYFVGTDAQFRAMWLAVRAKLATDHPSHPLGLPDTFLEDSRARAVVDYCATNSLPIGSIFDHVYSDVVTAPASRKRTWLAYIQSKGINTTGIKYYVTEWNISLQIQAEQANGAYAGSSRLGYFQRKETAAYLFASMAYMDSVGVDGATLTRLTTVVPEPYNGVLTDSLHPRPLPAFAGMQALWLLGDGTRKTAGSNWPTLKSFAATDSDGVHRIAYGTYRPTNKADTVVVSFDVASLPDEFTWERLEHDIADGRLRSCATGTQDNLPTGVTMNACDVGALIITPTT